MKYRYGHNIIPLALGSVVTLLVIAACNGDLSNTASTGNTSKTTISASQIVYRNASGQLAVFNKGGLMKIVDVSTVDSTTQFLAENVILAENTNSLTSENLQRALDDEIAPDLNKILPGTTWSVVNKNGGDSDNYDNTTGQVTFNVDGSIIYTGAIAAFGIGATICVHGTTVNYEALSSKAIYVLRRQPHDSLPDGYKTANVVGLLSAKKGELILHGQGGCGLTSVDRISTLTLLPKTGA
jgi:hypothetical protein